MTDTNEKKALVDIDRVARLVLGREGIEPEVCELSLTFMTPEGIRGLNREYRGRDAATDVLSFPMYESIEEVLEAVSASEAPVLLGDIVICEEIAKRQAEKDWLSLEFMLAFLSVHGALHLLGYDHEKDEDMRRMRAAEEEVLTELGYIKKQ